MKRILSVIACALALSACASLQPAPPPTPAPSPKPQAVPAWILEPGPNLTKLLDALISPFETESTEQAPSLPPAKTN